MAKVGSDKNARSLSTRDDLRGGFVANSSVLNWKSTRGYREEVGVVAVCRVNRGKVKLDALLPEGHTRAWQCKDVPLICQRLHVDLLDTGYPVGVVFDTMDDGFSGHSSRFSVLSSVGNVDNLL